MSQTVQDILECLEGNSEDQLVALIQTIHQVKSEKTGCAACGAAPCCCPPKACGGCGSTPCCCDPCTPNIGDYLLELGKLNLCFYEQLFEVNQRFHKTLAACVPTPCVPVVVCCTGCGATPCCCAPQEVQKTLCIEGEHGACAVGTFTITNKSRTDREVSFLTGEFKPQEAGSKRFVPALDFELLDADGEPLDNRVLGKGATGTVRVAVPLSGDFAGVGTYNGAVVVQSHTTIHLHLCVEVVDGESTGGGAGKLAEGA